MNPNRTPSDVVPWADVAGKRGAQLAKHVGRGGCCTQPPKSKLNFRFPVWPWPPFLSCPDHWFLGPCVEPADAWGVGFHVAAAGPDLEPPSSCRCPLRPAQSAFDQFCEPSSFLWYGKSLRLLRGLSCHGAHPLSLSFAGVFAHQVLRFHPSSVARSSV